MKDITQALEWRYATKQYDATKKLSDTDLDTLMESIRLAPSSYGLQPFKVIHVTNPELREKMKAAAWNQTQLTDASNIFVFAVQHDITTADVDAFINLTGNIRNVPVESLTGYADMIKGSLNSKTPEQKSTWAAKQAYLALGFLLETAALLHIDATPMEGFDNAQFDEILGLTEKGMTSVVLCALGYRSEADQYAGLAKVRASKDVLFIQK